MRQICLCYVLINDTVMCIRSFHLNIHYVRCSARSHGGSEMLAGLIIPPNFEILLLLLSHLLRTALTFSKPIGDDFVNDMINF